MLFIKVRIHRILAVVLVVAALVAVSVPPAPIGVAPASADSRCDQHYSHTHGWLRWKRTDVYVRDGEAIGPYGYIVHWVRHENSWRDWCDS